MPTQTITVETGHRFDLALEAKPRVGNVALTTTDPEAPIFFDDKAVGQSQFRGEVPVGEQPDRGRP